MNFKPLIIAAALTVCGMAQAEPVSADALAISAAQAIISPAATLDPLARIEMSMQRPIADAVKNGEAPASSFELREYAESRIAELSASTDPVAKAAAEKWRTCKNDVCVANLAGRETYLLVLARTATDDSLGAHIYRERVGSLLARTVRADFGPLPMDAYRVATVNAIYGADKRDLDALVHGAPLYTVGD